MKLQRLFNSALLAASLVAPTVAQDEGAVRSIHSQNWAYANDRGTASGYAGDLIAIRDCFGRIYACLTVAQWAGLAGQPFINEVVRHSGGKISIRFCYWAFFNTYLRGGSVEVISGGRVIDRDPLL